MQVLRRAPARFLSVALLSIPSVGEGLAPPAQSIFDMREYPKAFSFLFLRAKLRSFDSYTTQLAVDIYIIP
jgi:hypothetical protein